MAITDITPPKHRGRILKGVLLTIFILITLMITALAYGIRVPIAAYQPQIAQWLSQKLHRQIDLNGPITLELSLKPKLVLNDVTIANLKTIPWQPMAKIGHVSAQMALLPLLRHEIDIDSLTLSQTQIHLTETAQGQANWQFLPSSSAPNTSSDPWRLTLSKGIQLDKVNVNYDNEKTFAFYNVQLDKFSLIPDQDHWKLSTQGNALGQPYQFELQGNLISLINGKGGQLSGQGEFAGTTFTLSKGQIGPFSQPSASAELSLNWHNVDVLQRFFGVNLHPIVPFTVATHVNFANNTLNIEDLTLQSPITQGKGHLSFEFGQKQHIDGALNIKQIDLSPWLQPKPPMPMMFAAEPPPSPLQQALNKWLVNTQSHLALTVDQIKGVGTPVNGISLTINGKDGILMAPMTANIANVPFKGNAKIDATGWVSHAQITLGAQNAKLGEMAQWLTGVKSAQGHLKQATLTVSTEGTSLQSWIDNSQLALIVKHAQAHWGSKAQFAIDQAKLTAGMNQAFQSNIQGKLLNVPVRIQASAGTLAQIVAKQDWQAQLHIQSPAIDIKANGLLKGTQWQAGSHFTLQAHSTNVGLLSPWLGTQANAQGQFHLQGTLTYQTDGIHLLVKNAQLMGSQGKLTAVWSPNRNTPLIQLNGQFNDLNITQIAKFIEPKTLPNVQQTVPTQGVNLNVPILSHPIKLVDANVSLNVNQLQWLNQNANHIHFEGQLRNGKMPASPFSMEYAGGHYYGDIAFDLNSTNLAAALNLSVDHPNVGTILKNFDITNQLVMKLNRAQLHLALSGQTVLQLMEQATLNAQLYGGQLQLPDVYTGKALSIAINKGQFSTSPTTKTQLVLDGSTNGVPVHLSAMAPSLKAINQRTQQVPVSATLDLGEMRFSASSNLAFPINFKRLNLEVQANLPNLNRLDPFIGLSLPPYGPIQLQAHLHTNDQGYFLNNLSLNINHSQLQGSGEFLPQGKKPTVKLSLNAPFIQINDFKLKHWQAWLPKGKTPTHPSASSAPLISPTGLNLFNGQFQLKVGEVRSGKDWLGAGTLAMTLKDGLLTLDPLHVNVPGGDINLAGTLQPKGNQFDIHLTGKVKNFDYGILARRLDPTTKMHGLLSTQFHLNSIASTPDALLNNATGFIGFAVWPKAYQANLIDLWAVSLADAIIPSFLHHDRSVVNCVAAGINLNHGILTQKNLLMDTTRIQVSGQFHANYKNRTFHLYLTPRSKTPQIFSLQTPVSVSGSFKHFDFSVPWKAILETSIRFTTSPVVAPLRWLFDKPIPANDSPVCQRIWQGLPISS